MRIQLNHFNTMYKNYNSPIHSHLFTPTKNGQIHYATANNQTNRKLDKTLMTHIQTIVGTSLYYSRSASLLPAFNASLAVYQATHTVNTLLQCKCRELSLYY